MPSTSGITSGAIAIPTTGETSANVWYRLYLTVRDSSGLTNTVFRDIQPRRVRLTLATQPAGLQVRLDGQPVTAPYGFDSVVGIVRTVEAFTQALGGTSYEFATWSDGGMALHEVVTPAAGTTYTATYRNGASLPLAPTGLSRHENGLSVGLWWNRAPGAQSYLLEVGSTTGLADLFIGDIGEATTLDASAPPGTYFVRVRGINAFGVGPASDEVRVALTGGHICAAPPPAPAAASAQVAGLATEITWPWTPTATTYVVEAGSSTGLSNLYRGNLGRALSLTTSAPAGRYFVRVRAANACGESAPTADVEVVLSCSGAPIQAPAALTGTTSGGTIALQWAGSLGHTSYRLEVGSTPGARNLLDIDLGAGTTWETSLAGVAPGTYYLRVRAATGCGMTGPSNEITVVVP
jgi:hypothetical protein